MPAYSVAPPPTRAGKRRLDLVDFVLIAGTFQVDVLATLAGNPLRSRYRSVPLGHPKLWPVSLTPLQRLPK
jgi:hypothetical protein